MNIQRIPLTTADAFVLDHLKKHARVDWSDDDAELCRFAQSAVSEAEKYGDVAFLNQTVRITFDAWPRTTWLQLPVAPLFDPLSVEITADNVAFEGFAVTTGLRPAVRLTDAKPCGVIVIEYVAGFGPTAADVPPDLAAAINDQVASHYDVRGASDRKTERLSPHFVRVCARYRRVAL